MQLPYRLRCAGEGQQEKPAQESKEQRTDKESYGAVARPQRSSWERRGEPWELFVEAGIAAGRQFFALVVIIVQVIGPHSHDNLMNCDPLRCGLYTSIFCEYTKAYVRCFPLLALAVSLMVAARMVLNHRVYYQLLKHDLLISFEPLLPSKDALFRLLIWCFANAFPHFIANIWLAHRESFELVQLGDLASSAEKLMAANVLHDAHQVAVFYLVPAVVFLLFLYTSYDTEAFLLPLSKFFEDDFEASRTALKRVRFVKEYDAAARVQKGLPFEGSDGEPCTASDVFKDLADAAATDAPAAIARTNKQQLRAVFEQQRGEEHTRRKVTWTMWPASLLLDSRLTDKESVIFRRSWYFFMAVVGLIMIFVWSCLTRQLLKDFSDVWNGELPDLAGILVELGHFGVTLLLGVVLFYQTLIDETFAA